MEATLGMNKEELEFGSMEPFGRIDPADEMKVKLRITDPEMIRILKEYTEGRVRDDFALSALRIGLLSVRQAQGVIDSNAVRHEGEIILSTLQNSLNAHQKSVSENIGMVLKDYFDPQNGHFQEKLNGLLEENGEIERLMAKQIGPQESELGKTLNAHFGENAPLRKIFDPQSSDGILKHFNETFSLELTKNQQCILDQFSLNNKAGALSRLLEELEENHGELSEAFTRKVADIVREFSLDDENSALSRLVVRVEKAQQKITDEFSLDDENSSLARLNKKITEHIEQIEKNNLEFQHEIRNEFAEMKVRKEESYRGTAQGTEFEKKLYLFVKNLKETSNDFIDQVGNRTGVIKNSKKGDILIELGPDHVASGSRIVIEAKNKQGFDDLEARKELEEARKNRNAEYGIFVYSDRTFPDGNAPVSTVGKDIITCWDENDSSSDLKIISAITIARALCTMDATKMEENPLDIEAINSSIRDIEKQVKFLEEIIKSAETVKNGGEKILAKAGSIRDTIINQVNQLDKNILGITKEFNNDYKQEGLKNDYYEEQKLQGVRDRMKDLKIGREKSLDEIPF